VLKQLVIAIVVTVYKKCYKKCNYYYLANLFHLSPAIATHRGRIR